MDPNYDGVGCLILGAIIGAIVLVKLGEKGDSPGPRKNNGGD